jgi:hypothetical protein
MPSADHKQFKGGEVILTLSTIPVPVHRTRARFSAILRDGCPQPRAL